MLAVATIAVLASAGICYLVGYAFIAPRDSIVRSKRGITFLVLAVLSLVTLPPQLPGTTALVGTVAGPSLAWPSTISPGAYIAIWVVSSVAALLAGMRIWRAGRPGWRAGAGGAAYDTSKSGRAAALIALADTLDETFDILTRIGVDARGVDRIAQELQAAGHRFAAYIPEEPGAAYRLVAAGVPASIAANVTRHLLDGTGRGGQTGAPNL